MAVSAKLYGLAFKSLFNKEIDFDSDQLRVMLCTAAGYTPNQDTHQYKSQITGEVANGNGYATGGATLTGVALAYDAATNTFVFDAADVTWGNSTIAARYAVIYDSTPGTDATRPLIGYVDFGETLSSSGAAFSIVWDATGILRFATA